MALRAFIHRLVCSLCLAAHKGNETGGPVIGSKAAQMGIGSQQVFVNDTVVLPVYSMAALDLVSIFQPARVQILQLE